MDIDRISKLVSTKKELLNVPHTANLQRLVDDDIRQLNEDAGEEWEQRQDPNRPVGGMPVSDPVNADTGIETPTDPSGATQGSDAELPQMDSRRV